MTPRRKPNSAASPANGSTPTRRSNMRPSCRRLRSAASGCRRKRSSTSARPGRRRRPKAAGPACTGRRNMGAAAPPPSGRVLGNRQKIRTSGAHFSDYGLLITRTDPNVPKHKGLTMFFLDMKSPGIEVRPIKQANGMQEFNEVYFTDVVIPDHQRLGAVGDGWNVSLTTLMNERMSIGARLATGFPEMFDFCSNLMTEDGLAIDDRATRSKLAGWAVKASGLKYTSYRGISALSKGEGA